MKIGFVVLHYRTYDDTKKCIESILKLQKNIDDVLEIVIVDNASNNGSMESLDRNFGGDKGIHLIKNKKNVGFAEGNNIGYRYAKNTLKCNSIVVLNNDTVIVSDNIIEKINKKVKIIGPDIMTLDGIHQNPMNGELLDLHKVTTEILRYNLLRIINFMGIYGFLHKNKNNEKTKLKKKTADINCKLHGSALIFMPEYVKNEKNAFIKGTFVYMEEDLLYLYCKNKGYMTVYDDSIKIMHNEDSATNSLFDSSRMKREFVFKNMIRSLKVYRNFISKQ